MRRLLSLLLALACLLWLAGCAAAYPEAAVDGAPWDESWEMLGSVLGVEDPGHGMTLLANNVVLAGDDTYYATWASGEPANYVNEDGDDTDLYEAELYLLLYGCADRESAEAAVADWTARQTQRYTVTETRTETWQGQEYTVLVYECGSDTNPYSRGISAFGIFEHYVVSAELTCLDSFTGDEQEIFSDFLNGCHYSASAASK